VESLHDLVAREQILEGARQYVMHAGLSIRSRRAFVKNILGTAFALLNGLLEDIGLLPEFQHAFFH